MHDKRTPKDVCGEASERQIRNKSFTKITGTDGTFQESIIIIK